MHEQRTCLGLIITYDAYLIVHRRDKNEIALSRLILRNPSDVDPGLPPSFDANSSAFVDSTLSVMQLLVGMAAWAKRNHARREDDTLVCWKRPLRSAVAVKESKRKSKEEEGEKRSRKKTKTLEPSLNPAPAGEDKDKEDENEGGKEVNEAQLVAVSTRGSDSSLSSSRSLTPDLSLPSLVGNFRSSQDEEDGADGLKEYEQVVLINHTVSDLPVRTKPLSLSFSITIVTCQAITNLWIFSIL